MWAKFICYGVMLTGNFNDGKCYIYDNRNFIIQIHHDLNIPER